MRKKVYFEGKLPRAEMDMNELLTWCYSRDITIGDFCELGGFQRASWYQWVGGANPSAKTRLRIHKMTGLPYDTFLRYEG